ncbi:hypothetical protein C0992_006090 [Termitomyces sp. T32_za158]|nr:hypothetical protein C0992_006090 [Termitomyces sp. T32_za158]
MSAENLVLDIKANTAIDKRTGFDIVNPQPHSPPPCTAPRIQLHKPRIRRKISSGAERHVRGTSIDREEHATPDQIMALVQERIKMLSLEEKLAQKDTEAKHRYADRFPAELPQTMDEVPNHIYHRIRLKDPSKVVNARGYSAPKRFHEPWKKLLEDHLATGRLRPSSSEFASPAFCIPKH